MYHAATANVLQTLTDFACYRLPLQIAQSPIKNGGRGLFATKFFPKNQPIGPILPMGSLEWRESTNTSSDALPIPNGSIIKDMCPMCMKEKGCFACDQQSVPMLNTFVDKYFKALNFHSEIAKCNDQEKRFPFLAERILVRGLLEMELLNTQESLFMIYHMAKPNLGEFMEKEMFETWNNQSKSVVKQVLDEINVNVDYEPDLDKHYVNILNALHVNSLRGPVSSNLYGALSFINHSCTPNCGVHFDQAVAYLVPNRDIPQGAELFINYAEDSNNDTALKESYLYWNYGIPCGKGCACETTTTTTATSEISMSSEEQSSLLDTQNIVPVPQPEIFPHRPAKTKITRKKANRRK